MRRSSFAQPAEARQPHRPSTDPLRLVSRNRDVTDEMTKSAEALESTVFPPVIQQPSVGDSEFVSEGHLHVVCGAFADSALCQMISVAM
jgi:hypothetical protein